MNEKIRKEKILNSKGIFCRDKQLIKKVREVIIEAKPTILKMRKTVTQLPTLIKRGILRKLSPQLKAVITPKLVETPLPPLNFKNTGQLCPAIAERAVIITEIFINLFSDCREKKTKITGKNPLRKSKINTSTPHFNPTTLATLVAPTFPEPNFLTSKPFTFLDIIKPKGTEPAR